MFGNASKTNNGKLLAAIAIIAMIVCALAVAVPSDVTGEPSVTGEVATVSSVDDFNKVMTGIDTPDNKYENVTTIQISGTLGSATDYVVLTVDKAVTITSAGTTAATVYGTFNVTDDGVTIDGLNINTTYNTADKNERNGINVLADKVTITDNTFTMASDSTNLSNGIYIWPKSSTQEYTITGNTFNNYRSSASWSSNAISVAEGIDLSGYGDRFPGETGTTFALDMTYEQVFDMVAANEFDNCSVIFSKDDYSSADVVGMRVVGTTTTGLTQNMDYFAVDGKNVTLMKQTSNTLDLSFTDGETFGVAAGVEFTGSVTFDKTNKIEVSGITAGNGGMTFQSGSVELTGQVTVSEFNATIAAEGDVVLNNVNIVNDPSVQNGEIAITGTVTVEGNVIIGDGVTLNAEAEGAEIVVAKNAILSVNGAISKDSNVTNNGTIALTSTSATIPDEIGGNGTIDTSAVASDGTLSGSYDTTTTFTKNQTITATGDIILVEGTVFTFQGTLIIPEGITLTVQDGAQLIVDAATGSIVNNGTIIIESDAENVIDAEKKGGFVVSGTASVTNNGTITLEYMSDAMVDATVPQLNILNGTLTNNGSIYVGEDSLMTVAADGKLVNSAEATINMNGTFTGTVSNAGTVNINGIIGAAGATVAFAAEGATVQIDYLVGSLAINDSDVDNTSISVGDGSTADSNVANGVSIRESNLLRIQSGNNSYVSGLTVTSVMTTENDKTLKADFTYNNISISGTVSAGFVDPTLTNADDVATATLITDGPRVIVTDNLALARGIVYTLHDTLTVEGTVSVEQSGTTSGFTVGTQTPTIDITDGTVTSVGYAIPDGIKVNAASYSTKTTTAPIVTTYYYTTLANALASGATPITITGDMTIDEALTIPAGVTVNHTDNSKLTIADEGSLTIADTGRLNSTNGVTVDGSLYAENKRTGLRGTPDAQIISEVKSEGETDILYTNLVSALNNSTSGDVIKLSGAAEIDVSVAIPEGVTLQTMAYELTVNEDVVFTIDGTLYINNGGSFARGALTDSELNKYGEVVLNGTIQSETPILFTNPVFPAGAYYTITTNGKMVYYLQPLDDAVAVIGNVDQSTITVMGEVTVGDIAVTGTADKTATLIVNEYLTAGTITLSYAQVKVVDTAIIDAVVADATGSVDIVASGSDSMTIVSDETPITVTGNVASAVGEDLKYSFTVSNSVNFDNAVIPGMTVDGTATIVGGTTAKTTQVNGNLDINGTVDVQTGATLRVTGITTVTGTLNVAPLSTEGRATADLGQLLVGTQINSDGDFTAESAGTVTGPVSYSTAFVSAASEVPEDFVGTKDSTEFFVEDTRWMSVYGTGTVLVYNPTLPTSQFQGWMAEGETEPTDYKVVNGSKTISIDLKAEDALYASVKYDVYNVVITIDNSIGSIAIDGQMLTYGDGGYVLPGQQKLTAGQHTVTYTLSVGYEGEATLASGTVTVSGMTFTLDGDYNDTYYLSLGGATPADQTVVIEGGNGGSDSLGLTDYLLIILVVLIVIMAIIVAMRLMRS